MALWTCDQHQFMWQFEKFIYYLYRKLIGSKSESELTYRGGSARKRLTRESAFVNVGFLENIKQLQTIGKRKKGEKICIRHLMLPPEKGGRMSAAFFFSSLNLFQSFSGPVKICYY